MAAAKLWVTGLGRSAIVLVAADDAVPAQLITLILLTNWCYTTMAAAVPTCVHSFVMPCIQTTINIISGSRLAPLKLNAFLCCHMQSVHDWNSLPADFQSTTSMTFCQKLKTFISAVIHSIAIVVLEVILYLRNCK